MVNINRNQINKKIENMFKKIEKNIKKQKKIYNRKYI